MMKVQADVTGPLLTADKYWISSQQSRVTLDPEIGFLGDHDISDIGNEDFLLSCMETFCVLDGNYYCGLDGNLLWIGWKLTVN
jgi:hypothetical protein